MSNLYIVLDDDGATPGDQIVTFYTDLDEADKVAGDLQEIAGRVYQLVDPRTTPVKPCGRDRLNGLIQAVAYHAEVGVDEHEHVVRTAAEMAAFLADGTVPDAARDEPDFGIRIERTDDRIRVIVQHRVIAELDHDQAGREGLDALEAAVLGAVRACGVEPLYSGPGEAA